MGRGRYRMGSVEVDGVTLTCNRGDQWPPMEVIAYGPTANDARPHITSAAYERCRVWEQACGLVKMNTDKCPTCPYRVEDGVPAHPGGRKPRGKIHTTTATRMANAVKKEHG